MKIRVWCETEKTGSRVERIVTIDDRDLRNLTQDERDEECFYWAQSEVMDTPMFEWGWEEVSE